MILANRATSFGDPATDSWAQYVQQGHMFGKFYGGKGMYKKKVDFLP